MMTELTEIAVRCSKWQRRLVIWSAALLALHVLETTLRHWYLTEFQSEILLATSALRAMAFLLVAIAVFVLLFDSRRVLSRTALVASSLVPLSLIVYPDAWTGWFVYSALFGVSDRAYPPFIGLWSIAAITGVAAMACSAGRIRDRFLGRGLKSSATTRVFLPASWVLMILVWAGLHASYMHALAAQYGDSNASAPGDFFDQFLDSEQSWAAIEFLGRCASLASLFLVVPAVWTLILLKRFHGQLCLAARNHCPACGYDLRATPGRCSECGWSQAGGGV